jgi:hypothetical protein
MELLGLRAKMVSIVIVFPALHTIKMLTIYISYHIKCLISSNTYVSYNVGMYVISCNMYVKKKFPQAEVSLHLISVARHVGTCIKILQYM